MNLLNSTSKRKRKVICTVARSLDGYKVLLYT
jgi:hypothetical protein